MAVGAITECRGGAYPKGTGSTDCSFFAGCRWRCSARDHQVVAALWAEQSPAPTDKIVTFRNQRRRFISCGAPGRRGRRPLQMASSPRKKILDTQRGDHRNGGLLGSLGGYRRRHARGLGNMPLACCHRANARPAFSSLLALQFQNKNTTRMGGVFVLERATRLELATSTLARSRSTR